jgi:Domain of unknown function (DUF6362)
MSQFSADYRTAEAPIDTRFVTSRLEEAGAALLALPHTGWSTKLRTSNLEVVRAAMDSYGWGEKSVRRPVPSASTISRMDEAMGWLQLIPVDRYVLRHIVGARSLVNPLTDRHLFPWRRLGAALGADHKAVQRWHAEGIALIVAALNGGQSPSQSPAKGKARMRSKVKALPTLSPAWGGGLG